MCKVTIPVVNSLSCQTEDIIGKLELDEWAADLIASHFAAKRDMRLQAAVQLKDGKYTLRLVSFIE